jgi:hypothetical protein
MLDVHLPHRTIDGIGEFLLHIFTITVGLLIAVGIEAAVERHQHRELAAEAKETMTAEIRKNDKSVDEALTEIIKEQDKAKSNMAALRKIQLNPNDPSAKDVGLDISFNTTGMEDTAWRTAQATGALAYMPYADAEKFTVIYGTLDEFLSNQKKLSEDESRTLGTIQRYIVGSRPLTKEGADAMAEQIGIWQGHILTLKVAARVLQEEQKAFLEGREPSHNMSEKLSN